jgi:hypothetical protein
MNVTRLAVSVAAASILAVPASAATTAMSRAFGSVFFLDVDPEFDAVRIEAFDGIAETTNDAIGDGAANPLAEADADTDLGTVEAIAETATVVDGAAADEGFAGAEWLIENLTDQEVEVFVEFEHLLTGFVMADDPAFDSGEAYGEVSLSLLSFGDLFLAGFELPDDGMSFDLSDGGLPIVGELSFLIPAQDARTLSLEVIAGSFSDSTPSSVVAPIPLPAALPMLAAGALALVGVARRRG